MTHEQCKELFIESLYHELTGDDKKQFDGHLSSCTDCQKEYRMFELTLSAMSQRVPAEPSKEYAGTIWDRVQESIGEIKPAQKILPLPSFNYTWAYGIAAVLLVTFGIYIGKMYFTTTPAHIIQREQPPVIAESNPPSDSLDIKTRAYLERSKVFLQGLVNLDKEDQASYDLTRAQRISRDLIGQAGVLTVALDQPGQQQIRELISDLQIILLQLANIEVKPGIPAIELVKKGVDKKSILFKINLEELRAMAGKPSKKTINDSSKTNL